MHDNDYTGSSKYGRFETLKGPYLVSFPHWPNVTMFDFGALLGYYFQTVVMENPVYVKFNVSD